MNYTIKAHPTTYHGVTFRSRLEATWAAFFDLCGWDWRYEPIDFPGWSPDFSIECPNGLIFVEIKPSRKASREIVNKIMRAADAANIKTPMFLFGLYAPLSVPMSYIDYKNVIGTLIEKDGTGVCYEEDLCLVDIRSHAMDGRRADVVPAAQLKRCLVTGILNESATTMDGAWVAQCWNVASEKTRWHPERTYAR